MKKIFAPNLSSPKLLKTKEIPSFPGPKAFIPLPQICDDFGLLLQTNMKRKVQCYRLNIQKCKDNSFIQTYSWRLSTSLPIVRTFYLNVVSQQQSNTSIQVFNQHCPYRLSYFHDLPASIIFYLLKQTLIGLERLLEKFGPFIPTENMIAINQNGKCKVWMNQNFALNYVKMTYQTQEQFLRKIFIIFQQKSMKNQTLTVFFRQAFLCTKFLKALKLIDAFASVQKIKIPMRFDVTVFENRKKLNFVRQDSDLMKSSNISKFFKSANYTTDIMKKSSSPRKKEYFLGSQSAYSPTKGTKSSKCLDKSGTTLSQTYIKKKQQYTTKHPGTSLINCQSQIQDDFNSPQTPMRKTHSKRVKGSLFMSGSIDADCLMNEKAKKASIIKNFPQLTKEPLAESTMLSPEQINFLSSKTSKDYEIKIQTLPSNDTFNLLNLTKFPKFKRSNHQDDQQFHNALDVQPILLKNGWQRRVENLLGVQNSKELMQSRCQGKQIRADTSFIKLLKLDALGVAVTSSILPDDYDLQKKQSLFD